MSTDEDVFDGFGEDFDSAGTTSLLDDDDDVPISTGEDIATIESKTRSGEGFFDDAAENATEETDDSD